MGFNYNGHDYQTFIWDDVDHPKGVVMLIHGAHEYLDRYEEFATFLNANGYICTGIEHLGHGTNATEDKYVSFDNKNGYEVVLNAQMEYYNHLNKSYELPMFVFGHSMGSFILRSILPTISITAKAVVISGTTHASFIEASGAKLLAGLLRKVKGPEKYSKLLFKLSMGNLAKDLLKSGEIKNGYEWLTTDESFYPAIAEDQFLHKKFTIGGNHDMFTWIKRANTLKYAKWVRKSLPVYLMSGEKDPMNLGRVAKVNQMYHKAGLTNVEFVEYDGRHEMLNEVIRETVYADILDFYNKQL
jgi:alpha-beta hydrolase superfamily lysophospholipase